MTTSVAAQGCGWSGSWHCDSVSADVDVSDDGIKICARVAGEDLCATAKF